MSKEPTKTELRWRLQQARLEIPDQEHRLASQAIVKKLKQAIDWSAIKSLHYFEPIRELREPDINSFITYLEDTYPKLQMSTSRLIEDKWQIIGVHGGPPPEAFNVVLVPMLGFDPQTLHRLGYGGGYYDRFLAAQPYARKIGVSFEAGRVSHVPDQAHDIVLNKIITDSLAYTVGNGYRG